MLCLNSVLSCHCVRNITIVQGGTMRLVLLALCSLLAVAWAERQMCPKYIRHPWGEVVSTHSSPGSMHAHSHAYTPLTLNNLSWRHCTKKVEMTFHSARLLFACKRCLSCVCALIFGKLAPYLIALLVPLLHCIRNC